MSVFAVIDTETTGFNKRYDHWGGSAAGAELAG